MGYAVYKQKIDGDMRWAGYAVPAECDWTDCATRIHRGIDEMCETHGYYDAKDRWKRAAGCGYFFCETHRHMTDDHFLMSAKPDLPEVVDASGLASA